MKTFTFSTKFTREEMTDIQFYLKKAKKSSISAFVNQKLNQILQKTKEII